MSKNNENELVPRLRFPEFKDSGLWEVKFIEQYFDVGSSKRVLQEDWTNLGVPFYRTRELVSLIKNEPFGSEVFISENLFLELKKNYGVPTGGDFLVSGVGTLGVGYQVKAEDKFYFKDGNVLWFKLGKGLHSTYFKYCFQSDHIQNQIIGQASISTVGTYTIQNAKKTKFWFPPTYKEQQKIAACLSSLDEVITAESQKLEVLKEHKKGLLQNLFPQEGEAVPKLRFKEFEDSGEWVEKRLGEIGEFTGGGTPSRANQSFWTGDIPWISSSDINEDSIFLINISRFISNEALRNSATKLVSANSILLVSRVGVGKLAITKTAICTSQDFTNFTPICDNLVFLAYYLKNQKEKLLGFSQGMAIKGFTKEDVSNLVIYMPSIQEQKKIASCLSSLDDFIIAQNQKIEQLKQHKKGLLQGLLPQLP